MSISTKTQLKIKMTTLINSGLSNKAIAAQVGTSFGNVKRHRKRIDQGWTQEKEMERDMRQSKPKLKNRNDKLLSDRPTLENMDGERSTFVGTFSRFGEKRNYKGGLDRTILLKDIIHVQTGKVVTNHLWFNFTKGFSASGILTEGCKLQFDARIKAYQKGYVNHRKFIDNRTTSYKLSHPTKISIVESEN